MKGKPYIFLISTVVVRHKDPIMHHQMPHGSIAPGATQAKRNVATPLTFFFPG